MLRRIKHTLTDLSLRCYLGAVAASGLAAVGWLSGVDGPAAGYLAAVGFGIAAALIRVED